MTPSTPFSLAYSDDLQRNIITYLSALSDVAYLTSQPAHVFETEVPIFFRYVVTHFGPDAQKIFLWCKHLADDILISDNLSLAPNRAERLTSTTFLDREYLDALEQTREYLNRLVADIAHDLLGRTPDALHFYLSTLVAVCPPDNLKPLLLMVQHTAESYLWLGYDVYQQSANQLKLNEVDQGRNQVNELQKHITDGHALANFISWRLLKFRKILWFHLISTTTYSEMADACMAFFANGKRQ